MPEPSPETPPSPQLITPRNLRRVGSRGLLLGTLTAVLALALVRIDSPSVPLARNLPWVGLACGFAYGFAFACSSLLEVWLSERRAWSLRWQGVEHSPDWVLGLFLSTLTAWVAWSGATLQAAYAGLLHLGVGLDFDYMSRVLILGVFPAWAQGCSTCLALQPPRGGDRGLIFVGVMSFALGFVIVQVGRYEERTFELVFGMGLALYSYGALTGLFLSWVYKIGDRWERRLFPSAAPDSPPGP